MQVRRSREIDEFHLFYYTHPSILVPIRVFACRFQVHLFRVGKHRL